MKEYTVIFADLDGTIIDTISGETFPKGICDGTLIDTISFGGLIHEDKDSK